MDLIARFRAWALARPRVLLVDVPGGMTLRWSVEAELDRRGWRLAVSPADADLLVVLGEPGPELAAAVDVLWSQIAEPRHRVDVHRQATVAVELDAGAEALMRRAASVSARDDRPSPASLLGRAGDAEQEGMDHGGGAGGMDHGGGHEGMDHGGGHEGMDHGGGAGGMDHGGGAGGMDHGGGAGGMDHGGGAGGMDHGGGAGGMDHGGGAGGMDHGGGAGGMDHGGGAGGMDHGGGAEGMDHGGGHEGMDHGGGAGGMDHMHHGGEVAGLAMASTGPDRDGLQLDVLKVALGPVLPGWPTGLVLRAELRGDILGSVELSWLDAGLLPVASPSPDPQQMALDRLARFLDVAGWPSAARDARRARDGLAGRGPGHEAARRLAEAVARRVRRSRALSWTAVGTGTTTGRSPGEDVLDRVRRWCDIAAGQRVDDRAVASPAEVAALLDGVEIGSARLIVASHEVLPTSATAAPEPAHA